ncbi:hypothetical protein E4U19_001979 [Claviceps sp. Clav32 group G5]|nr:hypothetical protein E4U19_001979 [Claviceps sp. Clav32 group G5]
MTSITKYHPPLPRHDLEMDQVPARFQCQNSSLLYDEAPQFIDHFWQYLDEDPIVAKHDFDVIDYWMKCRVT